MMLAMKDYHHVFSKKRQACQSHLAKNLASKNDREHFLKIAKEKIAALHEGNFARYRLRPGEFKNWLATVKHPNTKRPYTKMVCQPMLELFAYLRVNGFKIFIVSGGGIEFMHPWTERAYDIPPEQVIGSSIKTKFELRNGNPVPVRLPESTSSMTNKASPWASTSTSAVDPFSLSTTPTATFRCSSGQRQDWVHDSWALFTTPTPSVSGLMTGNRISAV
jgi:hypothetical protein